MSAQTMEDAVLLSTEELRAMAECTGPCISIYLPVTPSGVDRAHLNSAMHRAADLLAERKVVPAEAEKLLGPIRNFAGETLHAGAKTVALFSAPGLFRSFGLQDSKDDMAAVAGHFHVMPLLSLLERPRQFFILALSQKHVRLLRCTNENSEEVELPSSIPRGINDNLDVVDQKVDQHSSAGPSQGAMRGVAFGAGSSAEHKDEYLLHFYKAIDKGLQALLKDDATPLIVAGVDYELALYHKLSKVPNLVEGGVQGAPDGLKGGELHRRALKLMEGQTGTNLDSALRQYEKQGGTDKTSTDAANILKAAREGRVAHLILSTDTESLESHNAAALQTILHSGRVHLAARDRMPDGSTMASVFRY